MGGRHPACVHLTRLTEPEERSAPSRREANPRNGSPVNFTSDVSVIIRSQRPATFWASSARPDPTTSDFATATTSGTFMVQEAQASWSVGRTQAFDSDAAASSTSSEVLAVDWLDRNTLLNGCRDGSVRLWDARAVGKGATSWRVRHPSCINHVRAVDVYHIVVAGIENRLCSYDLRFIRPEDGVSGRGVTRPFVSFPTYRNRDLNGIAVGFDVCGDLVAAGTDDQRVQVFDLGSGKELQVGMGGELGRRDLGGPVRCLRFVEGEGKPEGMKLFVATWRGIEEWAW